MKGSYPNLETSFGISAFLFSKLPSIKLFQINQRHNRFIQTTLSYKRYEGI